MLLPFHSFTVVGVSNFHYHQPLNKVPVMGNDSMSYAINTMESVLTFMRHADETTAMVLDYQMLRVKVSSFELAEQVILVAEIAQVFGKIANQLRPLVEVYEKCTNPHAHATAMLQMRDIVRDHEEVFAVYCRAVTTASCHYNGNFDSMLWREAADVAAALDLHITHVSE